MSNFESVSLVTESLVGTAPSRFVASTTDSFATIVAAGYLNDMSKKVKAGDVFEINYSDASNFPLYTGQAAVYGVFRVQYDPVLANWNLVPTANPQNIIGAMGVEAAVYQYAGGSATLTINDPNITPNSVVIARVQTSSTAAIVKTVAPANGSVTIVLSADPGASVIEYMSILPSVALQNAGVIAAKYTNAGGSATITISNASITSSMLVTANFVSQANAAEIKTVIAGSGTITIVATADPGASVIAYSAVLPSSALTTLGLYAASYSNAGGSATITITDATITVNSIVVADFASLTNAAEIEKVTPGAGTLTILATADPGVSVVNYQATPGQEGAQAGSFLPLSGGQMLGSILFAKGTGTVSGGAVTIHKQTGVITTTSLTTAAGSSATVTLTNNQITTSSVVLVSLMGGTNTTIGIQLSATAGAGSSTITISNNNAAAALNGTLIIGFAVH